jgi:hypothetical protein
MVRWWCRCVAAMRDPRRGEPDLELQRIWNDPDLLRRWTLQMLYEVDGSPQHPMELVTHYSRDELLQFARHPAFARGILRELLRKRSVGRPKGRKPGLADAWDTAKYIRQVWRHAFGHSYRSATPTPIEIAAAWHVITPEQLINFVKNKRKKT